MHPAGGAPAPDPDALWRDPAHWYARTIYYAPADPRVYVPKWGGDWRGQTLNMARGTSWALLGLALAPAALIAGVVWWSTR